jgi:hypothetical protein
MRIPVPDLLHFIATVAQVWLALSVVAAIAWCALVTSYKRRAQDAADEIDARFEQILTAEGLR